MVIITQPNQKPENVKKSRLTNGLFRHVYRKITTSRRVPKEPPAAKPNPANVPAGLSSMGAQS